MAIRSSWSSISVQFSRPAALVSATAITLCGWIPPSGTFTIVDTTNKITFGYSLSIGFSVPRNGSSTWAWTKSSPALSGKGDFIAASYTIGSGVDAIIYVNGAAVATSETIIPAVEDMDAGYVRVRNGQDVRIYNRVLSAAEVAWIYNKRTVFDGLNNGLIFHAPLLGCSGVQSFDGASIPANSRWIDRISGAVGLNPEAVTGVGNTFQRISSAAGHQRWA